MSEKMSTFVAKGDGGGLRVKELRSERIKELTN
jgi:hypothetical protein